MGDGPGRTRVGTGSLGDRLSARAQTTAIVTGNLVIFVFAIVILLR